MGPDFHDALIPRRRVFRKSLQIGMAVSSAEIGNADDIERVLSDFGQQRGGLIVTQSALTDETRFHHQSGGALQLAGDLFLWLLFRGRRPDLEEAWNIRMARRVLLAKSRATNSRAPIVFMLANVFTCRSSDRLATTVCEIDGRFSKRLDVSILAG